MDQKEELIKFAKDYLECWTEAVIEHDGAAKWRNRKNWTCFHEKNVLVPMADKINAQAGQEEMHEVEPPEVMEKEYYRIDFIFYRYIDRSRYFWTLDYAIEHENQEFDANGETIKEKGWFDEFCKLIPIKCTKARVIIGYDSFDAETDNRLERCVDMLKAHESYNDITDTPILLFLFPGTKYIKEQVGKGYPNGTVHVVLFTKQSGTWGYEDLFAKMSEHKILESKLLESFRMIAADEKSA